MILYVHNYSKIHPLEDLVHAGSGSEIKKINKKLESEISIFTVFNGFSKVFEESNPL